jgi:hypothetical protein
VGDPGTELTNRLAADPNWTDVVQTLFIGGQLLLLVVAAVYARSQLSEARELRDAQIRPFVVIDLDSPQRPFVELVVKNIGTTMARDVRFDFDPVPASTMKRTSLDHLKMYSEGIATLPPGKEIRTLFDNAITRFKAELPDVYRVQVSYKDHEGRRSFEESIDLDFGIYWNRASVTRHGLHEIHKQLDSISTELSKWTAHSGGGLLRVSPADQRRRMKEMEADMADPWWESGIAKGGTLGHWRQIAGARLRSLRNLISH